MLFPAHKVCVKQYGADSKQPCFCRLMWDPDLEGEYDTQALQPRVCTNCNQFYVTDPHLTVCGNCFSPPCSRCCCSPAAKPDWFCDRCRMTMDEQVRMHIREQVRVLLPEYVRLLAPQLLGPTHQAPLFPVPMTPPPIPLLPWATAALPSPTLPSAPGSSCSGTHAPPPQRRPLVCSNCFQNPVLDMGRYCDVCARGKKCLLCGEQPDDPERSFCSKCFANRPVCKRADCGKQVRHLKTNTQIWQMYCNAHKCRACDNESVHGSSHCVSCLGSSAAEAKMALKTIKVPNEALPIRILPKQHVEDIKQDKVRKNANPHASDESDAKALLPKREIGLANPSDEKQQHHEGGKKRTKKNCKQCNGDIPRRGGKGQRVRSEFCTRCRCRATECTLARMSADADFCAVCAQNNTKCASENCTTLIPRQFTTCKRCTKEKQRGSVKCIGPNCGNYCREENNGAKLCTSCTPSPNLILPAPASCTSPASPPSLAPSSSLLSVAK